MTVDQVKQYLKKESLLMKKMIFIVLMMVIVLTASSCVKQYTLTPEDINYVFTFHDIQNFNLSDYHVKKMKNGKEYFFSKTEDKINGFYSMYSITMINRYGEEIRLKTSFSIQNKEKGAKQLFAMNKKSFGALFKKNLTSPKIAGVDEAFMINHDDWLLLEIRKKNLHYSIDIEGINIEENQIKEGFINKINNIVRNGIGKYKVAVGE